MNFFKRWFGKPAPLVECPRCLGKGHVDANDIIRLGQELRWKPGTCAFCNGLGKVGSDMVDKVAAGEGYLTTDLSVGEREKLFKHDKLALALMREHNANFGAFLQKIRQMHVEQGLDAEEITEWMIKTYPRILDGKRVSERRPEIIVYIKKVIDHKN